MPACRCAIVRCRRQLNAKVAPLKSFGFATLTLLCAVLGADVAGAEDLLRSGLELRGGVLAHDVPDLWSGFRLERGVDINGEVLFGAGWSILGGSLRPAIGGSLNTQGYTSKAYADLRWGYDTPSRVSLGIGLGAAVHDGNLAGTGPQGAGRPRSLPHSAGSRAAPGSAAKPVGLFRAYLQRRHRQRQRGPGQHRHPLRLSLLSPRHRPGLDAPPGFQQGRCAQAWK